MLNEGLRVRLTEDLTLTGSVTAAGKPSPGSWPWPPVP